MIDSTRVFGDEVYEDRRQRLQARLRDKGLGGMIVMGKANRLYLTGFGPDGGSLTRFVALCLPASGEPVYIVSDIDQERARGLDVDFIPVAYNEGVLVAGKLVQSWPGGEIGVDAVALNVIVADALRGSVGRDLQPADDIVMALRAKKSEAEIEVLREASRHTDAVAEAARALVREGLTERGLSGAMVYEAMKRGCDMPQIPLVLTGARATMPHLMPSSETMKSGDLVVIDFGVGFGGYETDICRTYAVGKPSSFALELHDIVSRAFHAAIAAAKPGAFARDVHQAAYDVIAAAGYGEAFFHGVGHGVGVQSHETPLLSFQQFTPLEEGMVLAIEPGIYTNGVGIRLEDNVVVRKTGAESLNRASMSL
ncbi:M24 family metallopeptidase [Alicyclobacillus ferrooxydans]|uniref:Peptidase M24 n=1 Tax=Alicyclobacillus ferrooxydans TaxID=471514 RepID=A0A0P9CGT9_9BACL|nr:Xaa-Pro peptidase family protein [Alicyclobacillus ferrooxydans]KPV44743.1 hypothetical protein AN477_05475 [Alicyclobacillus ferrooxydans]